MKLCSTLTLIALALLAAVSNACAQSPIVRFAGAETGGIYALHQDGSISFHPINGGAMGPPVPLGTLPLPASMAFPGSWPAFSNVVAEWPAIDHFVYGQSGVLYTALVEGALAYFHDNAHTSWDGGGLPPISLSNGWAELRWVMGDGDGILYGVDRDGWLRFYRHSGGPDNNWPVSTGPIIGSGWGNFKMVFPGRQGVLYAIDHGGNFYYNRDLTRTGASNTAFEFASSVVVGSGWNRFQHVVSTGGGDIYGIEANGNVFHYHLTVTRAGNGTPIVDWSISNPNVPINSLPLAVKVFKGVYCWPLSVAPGQTLDVMASCEGPTTPRFLRMMGRDTDDPAEDTKLTVTINGMLQPVRDVPARHGCGWQPSYSLTIPENWPSGMYSVHCYPQAGEDSDASDECTFVVKPPAQQKPKRSIAVLANVNTWNSYNDKWGGGKYTLNRAYLSFMRPLSPAARVRGGLFHLGSGEMWVQGWLETLDKPDGAKAGRFEADVFTDIDLHDGTFNLNDYCCLVINTHPEYWSDQMYQRLQSYLTGGGSVVYIAGNGIFERTTYSTDRQMTILDEGVDQVAVRLLAGHVHAGRSLFRAAPDMHERNLLGVSTAACSIIGSSFVLDTAYLRHPDDPTQFPGHPLLVNVNAPGNKIGETLGRHRGPAGSRGLGCDGRASGLETDSSLSGMITPLNCETVQGPDVAYGNGMTPFPQGFAVLATAALPQ